MEIAAVVAGLLVLIGVPVVVVNRDVLFHRSAAKRVLREPPLPFLIIPSCLGAADLVPAGVVRRNTSAQSEPTTTERKSSQPSPEWASRERWMEPFNTAVNTPVNSPVNTPDDSEDDMDDAIDPDDDARFSPDETVVFTRPVDEPIQILPGRLRIISGEPVTEDLRLFSRLGEPPRIVVGRDTGPPHRHITLHSPTVSRRHARMDFDNGAWTITNLSQTNPVIVNDRALTNGGTSRKLLDGDRIELGEVALRFLST